MSLIKKPVISLENAQKQIDRLKDFYDFDYEDIKAKDAQGAIKQHLRKLHRAIMKGRLQINDDHTITQKLLNSLGEGTIKELKYKTLTGESKVAMDQYAPEEFHAKVYALMGVLCGEGPPVIKRLQGADFTTCESLAYFFLLAV